MEYEDVDTVIAFHTKYHWKDKSSLNLIKKSSQQLVLVTNMMDWKNILLPRPGCSNGGLSWEKQVKPVLENYLDDRFTIICKD